MTPTKKTLIAVLASLVIPALMILPFGYSNAFINPASLIFLVGAAGLLQTFLAHQNLPLQHVKQLNSLQQKLDYHHLGATSFLLAGGIPGLVLAYALYTHLDQPSSLGPLLAVILLTLSYGLMGYTAHFTVMALHAGPEYNQVGETSWLEEQHYQLRRFALLTLGIILFTALIALASFTLPDTPLDPERFKYENMGRNALEGGKRWLSLLFDYTRLPSWILLFGGLYRLLVWTRTQQGMSAMNHPWILATILLIAGILGAVQILVSVFMTADGPFMFMLPLGPIALILGSFLLSSWLTRSVRKTRRTRFNVTTDFTSPKAWTRLFQLLCLVLVVTALSFSGLSALQDSFISIGLICLFGIYSFSRQRKLESMVEQRTQELALAHKRSESLLHNVLPVSIAERLKAEAEPIIADDHQDVSILFADIAGFTAMSSEMSSNELVKLLSEVFARFDLLAETHQVEKIKTIGDAYMVAAGVPHARVDHAQALAAFALDMQHELKLVSKEFGRALDIRIGIHSGPVTASVIGTRKFAYDLWGDTVNTASRMESNGAVGTIQISEETKNLITPSFITEPRGLVTMKGKGDLMTYFLRGSLKSPAGP